MERLIKLGEISPKNSKDIKFSKIGLGFEKLDRDAFDPSKCYDKISALGVKWARIQSGWAKTEKEKGVYDFSWLDPIVDSLIEYGLKPWLCLCYGNGLYSELAAQTFGAVGVPPINTPEAEKAWENYVRATVKHYEGRIDTFEIWNEPDSFLCWKTGANATELGVFTSKTSRYIKEVNKNAYVIGGVLCSKQLTYVSEALKAGLADNLDALKAVKDKSPVAISAGERLYTRWDYRKMFDLMAADYIQPDISHAGGIMELKKIAAEAECRYIAFAPHNPSGPVANAATLQLAATLPNFEILEIMYSDVTWRKDVTNESLEYKDGCITIPDKPGLGIEIDEQMCLEHPYSPHTLRHYTGALTDIRPAKTEFYF